MIQAIILGCIELLGTMEYICGTTFWSRSMVMATVTGAFMGDVRQGVIIGALLELAFLGSMAIGAASPPEMSSAAVLSTAFTILAGKEPQMAVTIALPIASVGLIIKNIGTIFIVPHFLHKADAYAKEGNVKKVGLMEVLGGFFEKGLLLGLFVFISFLAGQKVALLLINSIPDWVQTGVMVIIGLMPAIGFGILMEMTMNKQVACFFGLGFILSKYLEIPLTGVAIFGCILAIILVQIKHRQENIYKNYVENGDVGKKIASNISEGGE